MDSFPLTRARAYKILSADPVRPTQRSRSMINWHMPHITDNLPHEALVCIRRQQRKEVLHALRQTGRSRSYRPKRNSSSFIHCW